MADWAELRQSWEPRVLSILRIVVGLLFLQHGLNKLFDFPATATHHAYVLFTLVPGLAGTLEVAGGVLIVLGLFARFAALILSGEMAFAYFIAHASHGFFPLQNRGETAVLYCFVFLYLFFAGGGAWSLDRLRAPDAPAGGTARSRALN